MSKKILILNSKPHFNHGGIETYSTHLINFFLEKKYKVFEISQLPEKNFLEDFDENFYFIYHDFYNKSKLNKKKYSYFLTYFKLFWISVKVNKLAKKIIKKYNIDVVIDNNFATYITFVKNVKYIWVQHYDWNIIRGKKIISFLRKILFVKNRLLYPNIVVYSSFDKEFLIKYKLINQTKTNIFDIFPGFFLDNKKNQNIDLSSKTQVAYLGRLDDKQKNINFLKKIVDKAELKKINMKIDVYGEGPDRYLLENNKNIILHGSYDRNNIESIFRKIKILLLPSTYEGLGLVVVEALINGTPCIISNSYLNAGYLINDSRGKLLNKHDNEDIWIEEIGKFLNLSENEYFYFFNNCINFSKNNLNFEKFKNNWIDLIDSI
ncbi:glycosyltransferase family 4 protein [Mycoplasmoides pirum]|uniref:glycosyltransferase family 4 protein n=1 Tax=Mycoplasmoides pirum TaxID=2122 RepID=UPI0004829526|nr:glycosyltransferase family 4 protein [Mycoplasmoides pirum]